MLMTYLQRVYALHPLAALAGLCLVTLTIPAYRWMDAERQNVGAVPRAIAREGDETRVLLASESEKFRIAALIAIADSRADVLARVDRGMSVVQTEVQATREDANAHIVGITGVLDRRLESIQADANAHGLIIEQLAAKELGRAGDQVEQIGTEVQATLAESRRTVKDLHPQLLGLVAASKVAAGELATSGREFQRVIIPSIEKIGANSDRATDASARIAENFALASKPLPKWLRIMLAIAPPVAATGASAVGAGAALGAFR